MDAERKEAIPVGIATGFIGELIGTLTARCGKQWKGEPAEIAVAHIGQSDVFAATITFAGSLTGNLNLVLSEEHAHALATAFLGQASTELAEAETRALTQLLESTAMGFCTSKIETYGVFTATVSLSSTASLDSGQALTFNIVDDAGVEHVLQTVVSAELKESFEATVATLGSPAPGNAPADVTNVGQPSDPVNLDLVLDVELSVTLRFGQRQLTLREVLELTSGSVIELDRQVEEPVELLLEGKVIARGEAVVIDGNYGLRVTEVPQQLIPAMLR